MAANTKTFAQLEADYDSFYVPTFEIEIDGTTQFSPAKGQASSVRIQTAIEKANRLSFSVAGAYDPSRGDFTGLADKGLKVGNTFEVRIGYGSTLETVVTGRITDVKPNFPAGGAPTVDVVGHDYRYHMDQASGDESWNNETVEAATRSIANKYDFDRVQIGRTSPAGAASGPPPKIKQLIKDSESDLAFLRKLVTTYNYEMFSSGGVLRFRKPPGLEGSPNPSVAIEYGNGLRSFQGKASADKSQVKTVKRKGVNPRTGEQVSGSADRKQADGADEARLLKGPAESDKEAELQSESKANEIDHERRSSATTVGLPDLKIGDWVEVSGLGSVSGQAYDGTYYLHEVDHVFDGSGFSTDLEMSGPIPEEQP